MKVLLTTLNARYIHSSLALLYLQKYCKADNHQIIIKEFTINDRLDLVTGSIFRLEPDVVAFSCYIWNRNEVFEIANRLKKVKTDLLIIIGGPEVSYDSREIMKANEFVDFIIKGEGEQTLRELLDYLAYNKNPQSDGRASKGLSAIRGLLYRDKYSKVQENEERPLICNLDSLPTPYTKKDLPGLANKIIYYETSRGCPFNCSYCLSSTSRGLRYFSLDRVKKDLLFLINNRIKLIKFVDRTFNASKERAMEIFRFLVENRQQTTFHFEITADLLDEEMVDYLVTIPPGLFQFEVGIQSTNIETLKLVNRKMNFTRVSRNIKRIREANNIHLHLDLIAGLPGEDYSSFESSFNDVFQLSPHNLQLGFLKLLKGSAIRQDALLYGYKFTTSPPYEILENNCLAYQELLELKGIEDVLEKYFNSNRFEKSLQYIINQYYWQSPFKFFQELAGYFACKGLNKRAHSQVNLYNILYNFYFTNLHDGTEIFGEYLKYDLVLNNKGIKLPSWASVIEIPDYRDRRYRFLNNPENIERFLPEYIGAPVKEILQKVSIEPFLIDIMASDLVEINEETRPFIFLLNHSAGKATDITAIF